MIDLTNVSKQATINLSGHKETACHTDNNTKMNIINQMKVVLIFHCFLNLQIAGVPRFRSLSDTWCYRAGHTADPSACEHGDGLGPCGRVCLKGPGDVCGGRRNVYGQCGESLKCSACNRCVGCSFRSFVCFTDRECLYQDDALLK